MITKLILFGKTGMLGNYIYTYFKDKLPIETVTSDEYNVNIESFELIENILLGKGINSETCVINCIGRIPQRHDNASEKEYYVINGIFPHLLWGICKKYGAKMIQPTTDCVFRGNIGNYSENDIHDETSNYGMSKSIGEPMESTIIRCSIIGREQYNKKSLLEFVLKNEGNTIQGWNNHIWNGITCLEYCKVIQKILVKNMFWKGVRHILSPRSVSKYELMMMIKDSFKVSTTVENISTQTSIDKSLRSIYNVNDIMNIPDIFDQLKELAKYV